MLERDDGVTVNLGGYDSEVVNVDSDGGAGTDVTLNVGANFYGEDGTGNNAGTGDNPQLDGTAVHGLQNTNETLNVNLNGAVGYDVVINDANGINVTNLSNNGAGARTVTLDGTDGDNNAAAAGEGNSLNITGNNTSRLTVTGIYQETVNAAAYAGAVSLTIANDDSVGTDGDAANDNESLTINTGGGDDVVNIVADILDLNDVAFNLGGGTDRLIINESTRDLGGVDEDQVFKRISGTEELETRGSDATNGAAKLLVSIEDDSRNSGLRKLIVTNDGASAGNVDLDIDADYNNGSAGLRLTVEARSGDVNIDNGANVDLTVNLSAANSTSGAAVAGSGVVFAQTGSGQVDVNVSISPIGTTTLSASTLAGPLTANPAVIGNVRMDTLGGTIDSLTINEADGRADNGPINVTWSDSWAQGGVFTVNASDVTNDDASALIANNNTHTGGMKFIGVAEDDLNFQLLGTANDDTLWGGQRSDSINGGSGDDKIYADPAIGSVITPGTQMVKTVSFNMADSVDAGDTFTVTVGGQTYTYTAPSDLGVGGAATAATALAVLINGNQATVDGDANQDVSAAAAGGVITITGVQLDPNFNYALGEDFAVSGTERDRPTAVITVANEGYDIGDVLTINVNGTLYSTTVNALSTVNTLAAALAAQVNGGAQLTAAANGAAVSLYSASALTTYTITPSWTVDQLTTLATSKVATVTYSAIGGGETVSVTFSGGITVSNATVAGLAAAINGNGTLALQWNASFVGNVLTLSTAVAGAAAPANDFATANFNGSGTATFGAVAGTNAVVRTDNVDPSLAARAVSFTLGDSWYDGGDSVTVSINGTPYTATLTGVAGENDVDYTGTAAATQLAATLQGMVPAGYTAAAVAGVITVTAPSNVAFPSWTVALADVAPVNAQSEIVDVVYTGFSNASNDNLTVSTTIGGVPYTADTIGALITAINAGTIGTHGYTASPGGNAVTIRLTSPAAGFEPASSIDNAQIAGTFQEDGGATPTISDIGNLAIRATQVLDFTGMDSSDGARVTVNGNTYTVFDIGTSTQSLQGLVNQINAGAPVNGWTASVTDGDTITLQGPTDGSTPVTPASLVFTLDDIGGQAVNGATAGAASVASYWSVSATGFDPNVDSVSVTFDLDNNGTSNIGDLTFSGFTYQALADQVNANVNGLGANLLGISGAAVVSGVLRIYGRADGSAPVAGDDIPVSVGFAGTGGPTILSANVPGTAAVTWSQVVTVDAAFTTIGDIAVVELSNGSFVSVTAASAVQATNVAALAAALVAAINAGGGATVTAGIVGDVITLTATAAVVNPTLSMVSSAANDLLHPLAGVASAVTAGTVVDPYDVSIDFSNIGPDANTAGKTAEVAEVVLAGNVRYSASSVAALVTMINTGNGGLLPATGPNAASILGHGWVASQAGNTLILTGPANGATPNILFDSARLVETQSGAGTEIQESWHNLDNTTPTLQVKSGNANSNPAAAGTAGVAAATATANGNDTVNGGSGNDTILGMGGNDQLNGDAGNDNIDGGTGNDTLNGGDGDDLMMGDAGGDIMNGDAGNDTLIGGGGDDTINGGSGNNRLFGGDGNDTITAGSGDDFIRGGAGKDVMTGGAGADTFYFTTIGGSESQGAVGFSDQVTDFVAGTDKFQFSFAVNFYANVTNTTNLLAGLTDNSVVAGTHLGRAIYDSSAKVLYIDVNGDGAITASEDLVIDLTLTGVAGLASSDFLGALPPPLA